MGATAWSNIAITSLTDHLTARVKVSPQSQSYRNGKDVVIVPLDFQELAHESIKGGKSHQRVFTNAIVFCRTRSRGVGLYRVENVRRAPSRAGTNDTKGTPRYLYQVSDRQGRVIEWIPYGAIFGTLYEETA